MTIGKQQAEADTILEKQQAEADKILEKIEILDPFCILAGGAPRDWYLGLPANDLDFYIHTEKANEAIRKKQLKRLGFEGAKKMNHNMDETLYKGMPDLFEIWEWQGQTAKVQFMFMKENTMNSVVSKFDCSICKFWYKHKNSGVQYEQVAVDGILLDTFYVAKGYLDRGALHLEKMKKRFNPSIVVENEKYSPVASGGTLLKSWPELKKMNIHQCKEFYQLKAQELTKNRILDGARVPSFILSHSITAADIQNSLPEPQWIMMKSMEGGDWVTLPEVDTHITLPTSPKKLDNTEDPWAVQDLRSEPPSMIFTKDRCRGEWKVNPPTSEAIPPDNASHDHRGVDPEVSSIWIKKTTATMDLYDEYPAHTPILVEDTCSGSDVNTLKFNID